MANIYGSLVAFCVLAFSVSSLGDTVIDYNRCEPWNSAATRDTGVPELLEESYMQIPGLNKFYVQDWMDECYEDLVTIKYVLRELAKEKGDSIEGIDSRMYQRLLENDKELCLYYTVFIEYSLYYCKRYKSMKDLAKRLVLFRNNLIRLGRIYKTSGIKEDYVNITYEYTAQEMKDAAPLPPRFARLD